MIQRIQSVYLLLTTLLSFLFLKNEILAFSDETGSVIKFTINGLSGVPEPLVKTLPATILIVLIPVLSALIIFLFKNRSLQLILCKMLLSLISVLIIALVIYSCTIIGKYNAELVPGFKMGLPVIQLIFGYLAYRGIKKDDDLVKSYDRLR